MTGLALTCFVAPAATLAQNAYITNAQGNTVSVINTASPLGVAVTPDGSKVYVANDGDNTVSVISAATNTVISPPIPVGNGPYAFGLFIQPARKFAGTPGRANYHGQSVRALGQKFDGLEPNRYPSQNVVMAPCNSDSVRYPRTVAAALPQHQNSARPPGCGAPVGAPGDGAGAAR